MRDASAISVDGESGLEPLINFAALAGAAPEQSSNAGGIPVSLDVLRTLLERVPRHMAAVQLRKKWLAAMQSPQVWVQGEQMPFERLHACEQTHPPFPHSVPSWMSRRAKMS